MVHKSEAVIVAVLVWGHIALAVPTGTPTPVMPLMPTPVIPASGEVIENADEPAITIFDYDGGRRATVLSNYGYWATYDITYPGYQFVARGELPNVPDYRVVGDPGAVTQPTTGTVFLASLAANDTKGALLIWHSTDGVTWGSPVPVVNYDSSGYLATYADKPWLSVSKTSGRLWLVWNTYGAPEGPLCVSTSLDGAAWSPCYTPAAGQSAMSIAANGANSAVAIFESGTGTLVSTTCTATGLSVNCTSPATIDTFQRSSR